MNWFIYSNNNPLLFADPSGLKPSVCQAAKMSKHIYEYDKNSSRNERTVEGWRLIDVWKGRESLKMGIYIKDSDNWQNPSEYAIVFRGTSTWFDEDGLSSEGRNNLEAGASGKSADLWDAMNFAKWFVDSHSQEVTFVGHSKGGGEAIVAADYMDKDAITFNAANYSFKKYVSGKGKGRIDNYYIEREILSPLIGTASIGETHWYPTRYWAKEWDVLGKKIKMSAPIKNHAIETVIESVC